MIFQWSLPMTVPPVVPTPSVLSSAIAAVKAHKLIAGAVVAVVVIFVVYLVR